MALLTPEYMQTKSYSAAKDRYAILDQLPLGEGVGGLADFRATERSTSANMSVDVSEGRSWVRGDNVERQGIYQVVNDDTTNVTVPASDATNPRIDRLILQINDSSVIGSSDIPELEILEGTPTSGATLNNLTGAQSVPDSAILLADILVSASATTVTDAKIRDRRSFRDPTVLLPIVNTDFPLGDEYNSSTISAHPLGFGMGYTRVVGSDGEEAISVPVQLRQRVTVEELAWRYKQDPVTPLTGDYEFAFHDNSGRLLLEASGSFSGSAGDVIDQAIATTLTILEPGTLRFTFAVDSGVSGDGAYALCLLCDAMSEGPGIPNFLLDLGSGVVGNMPEQLYGATGLEAAGIARGVPVVQLNGEIG